MKVKTLLVSSALLLCMVQEALADKTYVLATGRRDPRMYAIDLKKAIRPENNNTPNAIVSRSKVALDSLDGRLLGDSANLAISEDGKTAYVVNHHGAIDNDEFLQHGGRGNIAVMNVRRMIDPRHDNTARALERHIDSGHFGAVGIVLLKDMFIIGNAESHLTEDGGNRITFVDRRTGSLRGGVELALGDPAGIRCPNYPVPFTSPGGPPTFQAPDGPFVHSNGALSPVPLLSPHPSWDASRIPTASPSRLRPAANAIFTPPTAGLTTFPSSISTRRSSGARRRRSAASPRRSDPGASLQARMADMSSRPIGRASKGRSRAIRSR
jgi:hypothetical protein